VQEVDYRDERPWPVLADGDGFSMMIYHPGLDEGQGENWRDVLPSPGTADSGEFAGSPQSDLDGDGYPRFTEYAMGTSDSAPTRLPISNRTFQYPRNPEARAILTSEVSLDLETWATDPGMASTPENGTELMTVFPAPGEQKKSFRLRAAPQ
jgi:hypothetical protein